MMTLILHFLLSSAAALMWANVLPGVTIENFGTALLAMFILGAVNLLVRPILLILTLPLTILTLGLFLIILNVCMLGLAAYLTPGFSIDGFVPALLFGVLHAITNAVLDSILQNSEKS